MKLTPAQHVLLVDLSIHNKQPVASSYAPARKLVSLGLAEWTDGFCGDMLSITDAGRAALEGAQ